MDNNKIDEAKRLISGIVSHQKNTEDRLRNFEDQVKDLKHAQKLLAEGQTKTYEPEVHNNDFALKQYQKEDGSVQWNTATVSKNIAGQGRVNIQEKGLLDADVFANQWHADLVKMNQDRSLARMMMKDAYTPKADMKLYSHLQKAPSFMKNAVNKIFSDNAGVGGEWIPDEFKTELYQTFQVPRGLRALLPSVQMERETLLIPKLSRGGRPYIKGVATDDLAKYQASTIETAQKTVRAKGLATLMNIDDAAGEDSAFAIIPALSRQIAQDLEDAFEDCMINGDTNASHQDDIANWNIRERWGASGLGGSSDHRRLFLGMRAAAFDKSSTKDFGGTAPTFAGFMEVVAELGELAVGNKVCVVSPEALVANFLQLDQVVTLEKFGAQATVLTGQLASLAGIPIVMSRFMSADMAGTGLYASGTAPADYRTGFLVFNTDSWYQYLRRQITIESDKDIASGSIQLVSTMRAVMDSPDADALKNVAYGFDLPI
jgi:HK97 family phage major capsid protein